MNCSLNIIFKVAAVAFFSTIFLILLVFYLNFKPIEIIKDVKLHRNLSGGHDLFYKKIRIGYMSGLDSWYVQDSRVYGSFSQENKDNESYFYIDICNEEVFITSKYLRFENFLDNHNISKNRRNYMSGNNVIEIRKFVYNKNISCKKQPITQMPLTNHTPPQP